MGSHVVATVKAEKDFELVGATDLGDNLGEAIHSSKAEVVVDFTVPDSASENCKTILNSGACPVIGTTGFKPEEINQFVNLSVSLGKGGIIAPNFAIGAILLMKFASDAARFMPDVEIIELHHDKKVDAPSGTAIKTAEWIQESRGDHQSGPAEETETISGARGGRLHNIPIHSVRLPGFVAHQEVIFGGLGQHLTIRHDSISRESFMPGVALAIRKVGELDRIVYGLENIMDI